MPTWTKFVVGFLALVGAIQLGLIAFVQISPPPETNCRSYRVMDVPSPSTSHYALLINEICVKDEQVKSVIWISTDRFGRVGTTRWEVFRGQSVQKESGGVYSPLQLRVTWLSNSELQISFPKGTQVQSNELNVSTNGIKISYQQIADRVP